MTQAVATSTPTPPTPPQQPGQNLGDAVRGAVNEALNDVLSSTRAELQGRIASLEGRREALTAALSNADSRAARSSIQSQIDQVDRELSKARSAVDKIDRQLAGRDVGSQTIASSGTPPVFPALPQPPSHFNPAPMVLGVVGIIFVGFPLALTFSRWLWKRSTMAPAPPLSVEQTRRFDRLEQSVDAIAIEVERISENQRYLTKLLAEPKQSAKIGS